MTHLQKEMISTRLRAIRNVRGKSQKEMGEITGLNAYYSNIERGQDNYSEQVILKIAEKLGVDGDWLLTGCGESPVPATKAPEKIEQPADEPKELTKTSISIPGMILEDPEQDLLIEYSTVAQNEPVIIHYQTIFTIIHDDCHDLTLTINHEDGTFEIFNDDAIDVNISSNAADADILSKMIVCAIRKAMEVLK